MCKIDKSLSPYPSRYPSPSQHVVIQAHKLLCDRCDGCDSLDFSLLLSAKTQKGINIPPEAL